MEIKARNVNGALAEALKHLKSLGCEPEPSRNGPVMAFPEPVITTYLKPQERVMFNVKRDANPVFHLMESIWMLAGREDVGFLQLFNSKIGQFSDDGERFNAAYGFSWRHRFGSDQLLTVIDILRKDPGSRQAVLQMWDADDLVRKTLDKACNMSVVFDCRAGALNMTVFNRSNDLYYGAYGANAVHFSFLQEFVAHAVGLPIGVYRQVSNNLHLYLNNGYDGYDIMSDVSAFDGSDLYAAGKVTPRPIILNKDYVGFLEDCEVFCNRPFDLDVHYSHPFFSEVARPLSMVSKVRKDKTASGLSWAAQIMAPDWRRAAQDWIATRESKRQLNLAL